MTTKKAKLKNSALLAALFIAQVPGLFYGTTERLSLGLFYYRSTRLDFWLMYYANAIEFFILALCLLFPHQLDKRILRLIVVITGFDLLHLITLSGQVFGISKVFICIIITACYEYYRKKKWSQ